LTLHESGYLLENQDWNYPGVFSPFWRLYHNGRPGHCVLFGEVETELRPEHLVLIPPHCLFHCLGGNPVPNFWLEFSYTRKLDPAMGAPICLPVRDTELCLIRDLSALIERAIDWAPTKGIQGHSLALLEVVLARPELRWQPSVPENFQRISQHIEANLASDLATPKLARRTGMCVAAFDRAFKRHFATTPARYVTEVRVREAARLMLQSNLSIEKITEITGFSDRTYFSRVFKKITRESPARFRRKHWRLHPGNELRA
jgi:AraC-like DNA-binding protein